MKPIVIGGWDGIREVKRNLDDDSTFEVVVTSRDLLPYGTSKLLSEQVELTCWLRAPTPSMLNCEKLIYNGSRTRSHIVRIEALEPENEAAYGYELTGNYGQPVVLVARVVNVSTNAIPDMRWLVTTLTGGVSIT